MGDYMKNLQRNLVALLDSRHWTQTKLAEVSGLTKAAVSRLCSGAAKDVELKTVAAIANGLRVPISLLFETERNEHFQLAELARRLEGLAKEVEQVAAPTLAPDAPPNAAQVRKVLTALLAEPGGRELLEGILKDPPERGTKKNRK